MPEIRADFIKDASKVLPVLARAIEFFKKRVGISDWRERLIGAGVCLARPWVRAVRHSNAELQRSETGSRFRAGLEKAGDFLVDGNIAGPTCGLAAATLDIPGEEFVRSQEATHAAHVAVAIAFNFIGYTV